MTKLCRRRLLLEQKQIIRNFQGKATSKESNSLPVTTTSASRNPALYCGHATQSRHNRMEQRPTSMPTASTPAVDSDDFMLFLHHMIDLVDDDNNTRGG